MQASRASSRALKHLATGSKQTRGLHMTGPATFSSLLTSERPAVNLARDAEDSKRPAPEPANPGAPVRHFNTSRSLKAVRDSSTIDFAFIPDFDPDAQIAPIMRVPILPQTIASESSRPYMAAEVEEAVMLPTIYTVAADGTHIYAPSAMADVSDNGSIDFQGMAAKVASKLSKPVEEGVGMTRQLWSGFVDDILGPKAQAPSPA